MQRLAAPRKSHFTLPMTKLCATKKSGSSKLPTGDERPACCHIISSKFVLHPFRWSVLHSKRQVITEYISKEKNKAGSELFKVVM